MISATYRTGGPETALVVEHDEHLLFWPFRVSGQARRGNDVVMGSWRGADLREAVVKAAGSGCLAVTCDTVDAVVAALAACLEAYR